MKTEAPRSHRSLDLDALAEVAGGNAIQDFVRRWAGDRAESALNAGFYGGIGSGGSAIAFDAVASTLLPPVALITKPMAAIATAPGAIAGAVTGYLRNDMHEGEMSLDQKLGYGGVGGAALGVMGVAGGGVEASAIPLTTAMGAANVGVYELIKNPSETWAEMEKSGNNILAHPLEALQNGANGLIESGKSAMGTMGSWFGRGAPTDPQGDFQTGMPMADAGAPPPEAGFANSLFASGDASASGTGDQVAAAEIPEVQRTESSGVDVAELLPGDEGAGEQLPSAEATA